MIKARSSNRNKKLISMCSSQVYANPFIPSKKLCFSFVVPVVVGCVNDFVHLLLETTNVF